MDLLLPLQIQRLGGVDSDFAPFVQHAGVPSVDIYYGRGKSLLHLPDSGLKCEKQCNYWSHNKI